jgi:hypothetical protein
VNPKATDEAAVIAANVVVHHATVFKARPKAGIDQDMIDCGNRRVLSAIRNVGELRLRFGERLLVEIEQSAESRNTHVAVIEQIGSLA